MVRWLWNFLVGSNNGNGAEDANAQRRKIVRGMFYWLLIGVIAASVGLVVTAGMFMGIFLGDDVDPDSTTSSMATTDQFLQGVVLTSLTGTIAALLTYMSMRITPPAQTRTMPSAPRNISASTPGLDT